MAETFRRRFLYDLAGVLTLAVVAIGLGLFARSGRATPPPVDRSQLAHPVFSLAEFRAYVDSKRGLVLDARSAADYARGHVPGALSLSVADFDTRYEQLKAALTPEQERVVIVYCGDMWCGLGDDLQQKLINRGFRHVGTFPDGWAAWRDAHLPVETPP